MRRLLPLAGATGLLLLLAGCAAPPASAPPTRDTPPAGAVADDQLGGAYPPADSVGVVVRDRTAKPADGTYSICYLNAFQTQPGEQGACPANTLSTRERAPVIDPTCPTR